MLIPCKEYELNNSLINPIGPIPECTLRKNRNNIREIKYLNWKKSKKKEIPYKCMALDRSIKTELVNNSPDIHTLGSNFTQPSIEIHDLYSVLICKWIISEEYQGLLLEAYSNNKKVDKQKDLLYEFFTDGSLKDRGNTEVAIRSFWI
jgi:hypothetical protein